jgi:flavin-binding protein dodecin
MTVTRTTTEINTISSTSFEDAIQQGIARATSTLRGVEGARINNMVVLIENGNIAGYKVNMEITFVLEDSASVGEPEDAAQRQPTRKVPKYGGPGDYMQQDVEVSAPEERTDRPDEISEMTVWKGTGRGAREDFLRLLERTGEIKRGSGELPKDFWDLPRPDDPQGLVRRAVQEDRR